MSLSYLINQSSKFIWYSAHYIISFKYATPIKIDKSNPPPFYGKMPSGKKLFFEMMKLLNEERKLINSKFYKIPKTELKDLINIDKKQVKFVSVLVNPDNEILEKIKDLNLTPKIHKIDENLLLLYLAI